MTRTVVCFTDSIGFGGAEQALLHLLAGLDRRRWRPELWYHPAPGLAPLLDGARAAGVALRPAPRLPLGRHGLVRIPPFLRMLRAERPAVFHAHLTWPQGCKYAILAAILARVPAIVATEQLFVDLPYDRSTRLQQRLIAAGAHRYIAVSRHVARRLHRAFQIPARQIAVIHNAVPSAHVAGATAGGQLPSTLAGRARPIVLTVARLDEQKGLAYLLRAAAQVPTATFVVAGDGPERAALEAQAARLGLCDRVVFLGYRSDIADLLACCDLFVLPSLYEGLPLAILEAMEAGKPVIASAIGGVDEAIVDGESGLLVPPADPPALAGAIRAVLGDPVLAARLAAAGHARVQEAFAVETMVRRVEHIYEEILRRGQHGHHG